MTAHTQEHIEKIRQSKIGTTHSEETKAKISQSMTGKTRNDETKEKIRATLSGRKASEATIAKKKLYAERVRKIMEEYKCTYREAQKIFTDMNASKFNLNDIV